MKNKKALIIGFKSLDETERDLLQLQKDRTSHLQPKNVIFFDSLNSFRGFMTLQKLELLTLIAYANPKSIYEIAQMTDRGLAPVQKDCQMLERTGFIKFEKQKSGRGSHTPKLKFDYDRILVQLPEHPYELRFRAAA